MRTAHVFEKNGSVLSFPVPLGSHVKFVGKAGCRTHTEISMTEVIMLKIVRLQRLLFGFPEPVCPFIFSAIFLYLSVCAFWPIL